MKTQETEIELYDVTNEGKGTVYADFINPDGENISAHPIKVRDLINFVSEEELNIDLYPPDGRDFVLCATTYTNDNLREVVLLYLERHAS